MSSQLHGGRDCDLVKPSKSGRYKLGPKHTRQTSPMHPPRGPTCPAVPPAPPVGSTSKKNRVRGLPSCPERARRPHGSTPRPAKRRGRGARNHDAQEAAEAVGRAAGVAPRAYVSGATLAEGGGSGGGGQGDVHGGFGEGRHVGRVGVRALGGRGAVRAGRGVRGRGLWIEAQLEQDEPTCAIQGSREGRSGRAVECEIAILRLRCAGGLKMRGHSPHRGWLMGRWRPGAAAAWGAAEHVQAGRTSRRVGWAREGRVRRVRSASLSLSPLVPVCGCGAHARAGQGSWGAGRPHLRPRRRDPS